MSDTCRSSFLGMVDRLRRDANSFLDEALLHYAVMIECANAAYPENHLKFSRWRPDEVTELKGNRFSGYVAANQECTVIAFRGSSFGLGYKELEETVGHWLTNIDYGQLSVGSCRIHGGFWKELEAFREPLSAALRKHHVPSRPLFLTGHSAGAALATLAAYDLVSAQSSPVAVPTAVCAFCSPRVGDGNFADNYPVPLFRFERGNDLVPHFPPPPLLYKAAAKLHLDQVVAALYQVMEFFGADIDPYKVLAEEVEYKHAGQLLYHQSDTDDGFMTTGTFLETIAASAATALLSLALDRKVPLSMAPARLMDPSRFFSLLDLVTGQISSRSEGKSLPFIADHDLGNIGRYLERWLPGTRYLS
jgi:hypothetical protein